MEDEGFVTVGGPRKRQGGGGTQGVPAKRPKRREWIEDGEWKKMSKEEQKESPL